jgi:hypothetical protein
LREAIVAELNKSLRRDIQPAIGHKSPKRHHKRPFINLISLHQASLLILHTCLPLWELSCLFLSISSPLMFRHTDLGVRVPSVTMIGDLLTTLFLFCREAPALSVRDEFWI